MIGRVAGAQLSLENLIASLRATGSAVPAELDGQLGELVAARGEIASAGAAELIGLERTVATLVAGAMSTAQRAQAAALAAMQENISETAAASQRAVQSAMDYTRSLALRFSSDDDERTYREREAERAAYVAAQQAKHTPEGDLNASGAAIGQMADAHAHGASGPEFEKHWHELVETTEKLREAVRGRGGSTKEFDDRLREDLRRIMKAKGLSDAEIDAKFAARPDPLEAAKAYVGEQDVQQVKRNMDPALIVMDRVAIAEAAPPPTSAVSDDPFAKLRATGVVVSENTGTDYAHGVTASASAPMQSRNPG